MTTTQNINNGWTTYNAHRCDYGGCRKAATEIVTGVDTRTQATSERRPLCHRHAEDHAASINRIGWATAERYTI